MNEEICDFKFAIWDLIPLRGRQARGRHDGSQFDGFLMQSRNHLCFQQSIIDDQFHPISGFISFFLNRSELRNELRFRPAAAGGSIVGSHRHSTTDQLTSNRTPLSRPGQRANQFEHTQGESLCSLLQFSFIHTRKACNSKQKSQIANLKSQIHE